MATIAVAMFFVIASCTKEKQNEVNKDVNLNKCINMSEEDPGLIHNELLIKDMLKPGYFERTNLERIQLAYDYYRDNNLTNLDFEEFANTVDTTLCPDDISLLDLAMDVSQYYSFCDVFIEYAAQLNTLEFVDDDFYFEQLNMIADQVRTDDRLNDEEKYFLLGGISVAINSGMFWKYEYPMIMYNISSMDKRNCPKYPRDPELSTSENNQIRWADHKGWCRKGKSSRSCSAYSASAQKHASIIRQHGGAYNEGD
ncbi:MAG: hypothetical protein IKQ94_04715 [Bacteroidales bacterium]|nr:hypothetical protein [Bacteroidales bacterium]